MSTRLYTFRVDKAIWWPTLESIRAVYLAEYPMAAAIRSAAEAAAEKAARAEDPTDARISAMREVDVIARGYTKDPEQGYSVDFQVFDEGDTWLVRPLEHGYFLLGSHERWPELIPVFYNNSTDVPPEQKANRQVADWVDEQILAHRYFVVPVLTRSEYRDIGWSALTGWGPTWPGVKTGD